MKKSVNLVFVILIFALLLLVPVFTILLPKDEISTFENRTLATEPELSSESVLSGDYFDQAETYLKDHVVLRNSWLMSYTWLQKSVGKPVVNNIIETDQTLLPFTEHKYAECASDDDIASELDQLTYLNAKVSEYGGKLLYVGVPGQITMFCDLYPSYLSSIPSYNLATATKFEKALSDNEIDFLNARNLLTTDDYLATDHHYTLEGAYKVYAAMCGKLGVGAIAQSELPCKSLPNPYSGSRSRSIYGMTNLSDSLMVFESTPNIPFTRTDNGEAVEPNVINLPETDTESVGYGNYMGGDIGECVIDTGREGLPTVLIYGDSYTNAVECYAYLSFGKTISVDMRYNTTMTVADYVDKYKPDYVVCIRDDGNYTNLEGNGTTY